MTLLHCLILAFILFTIGIFGVLTNRHLIGMLISIEIMLNAANINFVAFAYFKAQDPTAGTLFSIFSIAITACEMAVALAILIAMYRKHHSLDVNNQEKNHE